MEMLSLHGYFMLMKRISFLLAFILFSVWMPHAQTTLECLHAVEDARYSAYDVVFVFDSTSVRMEESGLSHLYGHKLYKVLSPAGGRDYNTVKMDYDPLSAFAEIQKVIVYRKDGQVDSLDFTELDYPAPAHMIYWGARQKMVTIGRLEPGDAVETFTYKKGFTYALLQGDDPDAKYIPPMKGHFYDIVPFWNEQPVIRKVYVVDVLTAKNLRYAVYHGQLKVETKTDANRTRYAFSQKDYFPIQSPSHTLANNDVQTKLLLSTAPNWEAKSTWFYGVNEDYGSFIPTEEVKNKVSELVAKAKTEDDTISILTHWVADNMRYSGISMGEGEGFTLHKCEMNYTDRCGVCKDKAGMLIAMLRTAGFEAYAAMTMAGERIDDIPADQFNHCVTVVKRHNGQYQLLDPTWVPGLRELWSSAEQQQHYLMGVPEGATLHQTPISAPENHYLKMTAKTKVNAKGDLTGKVIITAEGQSDKTVRAIFRDAPSRWLENAEYQLLSLYPNAVLKSVKYSDEFSYLEHPVKIIYSFKIPGYAVVGDREMIVTPFLAKGFYKFAMPELNYDTTPEKREYPFSDRCSRLVQISETMTVPQGYSSAVMPKERKSGSGSISFDGGYEIENAKVTFQETIRLGKRVYEASEWPAYRSAVVNQKFYMNTPLILKK